MTGGKKLSGNAFRKKAKEKAKIVQEQIDGSHKIESFFSPTQSTSKQNNNLTTINEFRSNESIGDICTTKESCFSKVQVSDDQIIIETDNGNNKSSDFKQCNDFDLSKSNDDIINIEESQLKEIKVSDDPADWEINNELIDYIALHGIPQNIESDFSSSAHTYSNGKTRFMKKNISIVNLKMEKLLKGFGSHIPGLV